MTTRDDHLQWAKRRALQYVDAGDLRSAAASMNSDLTKHPGFQINPALQWVGVQEAMNGDADRVRRWIEGFQ